MKKILIAAAIAAFVVPAEADAQTWAAWHGCWRGVGAAAGEMVCVLPGADAASARFLTMNGNTVASESVVRADNVDRAISEGGCTGTGKAFFSQDRRRVFTRAELDCNGTKRLSSGVIALVTEQEWIEAQAITVAGQDAARSNRYRAVGRTEMPAAIVMQLPTDQRLAQEAARIEATVPLDLASVVEASRHLPAPAVEALLAARNHGFNLSSGRLVQMKEQGVAASTIDVMVALTYPERFAVRENRNDNVGYDDLRTGGFADARVRSPYYNDCYDSFNWGTSRYNRLGYSSCYDSYGYRSSRYGRYGYSPFGYDNYGWNYNTPIVIVVDPSQEVTRGGSVTRGGYTRGSGGSTTTSARPRDTGSSSAGSTRATAGTSSAGSSTGASTTGSSTTTTRTAKPRGGGGS